MAGSTTPPAPWAPDTGTFMTVTLPGTRYAVFSACCVVFTLTVTDFGVPKVVGGDYNVLAMEAYKAVVGQQNFSKSAAIGLMLLLPAVLTFVLDRRLRARQGAQMSGRAQPRRAEPPARRGLPGAGLCHGGADPADRGRGGVGLVREDVAVQPVHVAAFL